MSALHIDRVGNLQEAYDIAAIRNTGREFLTGNPDHITADAQYEWYRDTYLPRNRYGIMIAFVGYVGDAPAAYGMLNRKTADYWVTGVIAPEFKGQGFGEQLFRHMGDVAFGELGIERLLLDVRNDNVIAANLYKKLGYEGVLHSSGLTIMELENPHE